MPCRRPPSRPAGRLVAWKRRRCQIEDVASINQTGTAIRLPNFCNLGVMLRSLVIVNLLVAAAAVARAPTPQGAGLEFIVLAAFVEPVLILSLVALCAARRWLHAMGYAGSLLALAAFEIGASWLVATALAGILPERRDVAFVP